MYYNNSSIQIIILLALFLIDCNQLFAEVNRTYYPSGELESVQHYSNGKRDGGGKIYYRGGTLKTALYYKDGKWEGRIINYYENSTLKEMEHYHAGKREGIVTIYYANGILKAETNYINDRQEGVAKIYYEDGTLKGELFFKNGILGKSIDHDESGMGKQLARYYKEGKLIREEHFIGGRREQVSKRSYDEAFKEKLLFRDNKLEWFIEETALRTMPTPGSYSDTSLYRGRSE